MTDECCHKLRRDVQISRDSASRRFFLFFWPAVQFLGESAMTTERKLDLWSCVGTARKKEINIWEITAGLEQFLLFYENKNQPWLMNTDFYFGLTRCTCLDRHSGVHHCQMRKAKRCWSIHKCFPFLFCSGLIGTVPTISTEIWPVGDCCNGLRKYKCGNALMCINTKDPLSGSRMHTWILSPWLNKPRWVILQLNVIKKWRQRPESLIPQTITSITQEDTTPRSPFSCG